ncbi:SDR family oxidoreductase [Amycolatopsis ultiminotia]|uniref:SDR family oxidoreductase n=1 Tax=Amycolatopsis ultiminotia TaxID=543629 RepID=A0ABP6XFF5_9PSEU
MIVVTGATGTIGRPLVDLLSRAGTPFTALVRNERHGRELGCRYVLGDFAEPDSLAAAFSGADRVFLTSAGAVPTDGEQPMIAQQLAAITAARRAGAEAIVKVSVWRAREGALLAEGAHARIERALAESGLNWASLQPSGFMQNFRTGAGAFTDNGDLIGAYGSGRVSYIGTRDIAACAAALLAAAEPPAGTHVLTGPVALDHTEIAAKLSAWSGRTVRYIDLPPDEFAAKLTGQGLPAGFAADVAALYAEVAAGALEATTDTVERLTGRPPRSFDEFLADLVPAG